MSTVDKSELGRLEKLSDARGGQGKLFLAPSYRIPSVRTETVYKQYHRKIRDQYGTALGAGLTTLVRYPSTLAEGDRTRLLRHTVWPKAVVRADGATTGILMGKITEPFWFDLLGKPQLLEMQFLIGAAEDLSKRGVAIPTLKERALLSTQLLAAAAHIHKCGLVIGDVSSRNIIVTNPQKVPSKTKGGRYHVQFLDVDSFRIATGGSAITQADSPNWKLPELLEVDTRLRTASGMDRDLLAARLLARNTKTDVFKLGLVILRLFDETRDAYGVYFSPRAEQAMRGVFGARRTALLLSMTAEKPDDRPSMEGLVKAWTAGP